MHKRGALGIAFSCELQRMVAHSAEGGKGFSKIPEKSKSEKKLEPTKNNSSFSFTAQNEAGSRDFWTSYLDLLGTQESRMSYCINISHSKECSSKLKMQNRFLET